MNHASVSRLRDSYDQVAPRIDSIVDRFYASLYDLHPPVRDLFPADMTRQRAHLAAALAVIARNADRLEMLETPLMGLGAQHVTFGAKPEHYPAMRDALLDALAHALGDRWTPQLKADWLSALNYVVAAMLRGHARVVLDVATTLQNERRRPLHGPPSHSPSSHGSQVPPRP